MSLPPPKLKEVHSSKQVDLTPWRMNKLIPPANNWICNMCICISSLHFFLGGQIGTKNLPRRLLAIRQQKDPLLQLPVGQVPVREVIEKIRFGSGGFFLGFSCSDFSPEGEGKAQRQYILETSSWSSLSLEKLELFQICLWSLHRAEQSSKNNHHAFHQPRKHWVSTCFELWIMKGPPSDPNSSIYSIYCVNAEHVNASIDENLLANISMNGLLNYSLANSLKEG